jgi:hypothetical protein
MSKYVSDDHVRRLLIVETIIQDRPARVSVFPSPFSKRMAETTAPPNRSGNGSPPPLNRGVMGWSGSFTA